MLSLEPCKACGGLASLTFKLPVYGAGGCEIKCLSCGYSIRDTKYAEVNFDEGRSTLSTPVTPKSIYECIERTMDKWNGREDNAFE